MVDKTALIRQNRDMNNELTFNEPTPGVIGIFRGTARIADICKIDKRTWGLIAGNSMIAFGTRAKMRRYAVKWLCECAECAAARPAVNA